MSYTSSCALCDECGGQIYGDDYVACVDCSHDLKDQIARLEAEIASLRNRVQDAELRLKEE